MNFGGFLHSELVMRIMGDLVVHKPTTAIVYNDLVNEFERLPKVAFTIMLKLNYRYEKE
jgi:hypothetical protein